MDVGFAFTKGIGKFPLECLSSPGFVVNRVLAPYMGEAMAMAKEGVPLVEIDKAAVKFGRDITDAMQTLGMAGGVFEVAVSPRTDRPLSPHGMDSIEFRVSANKGQPVQALSRVASGGELSRISLSIQVISAGSDITPTMIFDEVDTGIGGGVAEIVGQKLRALGADRQVLCVTHLPQLAGYADAHLRVSKSVVEGRTRTIVEPIEGEARIAELAQMLDRQSQAPRSGRP